MQEGESFRCLAVAQSLAYLVLPNTFSCKHSCTSLVATYDAFLTLVVRGRWSYPIPSLSLPTLTQGAEDPPTSRWVLGSLHSYHGLVQRPLRIGDSGTGLGGGPQALCFPLLLVSQAEQTAANGPPYSQDQ